MSKTKRKIGNYTLNYLRNADEEKYFDRKSFIEFIEFVNKLGEKDKLINIKKYSKAVSIESIEIKNYYIEIIFKNCKYNHSPNYMSSINGAERVSDKKLYEGEKEITHLYGKIEKNECVFVLEERRSGVTMTQITEYFNKQLHKYNNYNRIADNYSIEKAIIPDMNFMDSLEDMSRIKAADIYVYKDIIGSEELDLLEFRDNAVRDDVVINIKARKNSSLFKSNFKKLFNKKQKNYSNISRIRLYGKSLNGFDVCVDTDIVKKTDYIEVAVDESGIIKSPIMFSTMKEYLIGSSESE